MKKGSSHMAAPSWIPFLSQANLSVDNSPVIDFGSNESKILVFVCTCNSFSGNPPLFVTLSSCLDGLLAKQ